MKLFLIILFFACINALTLPIIFKSGMVLQSEPTNAVIWEFLGKNKNPVNVDGECNLKGQKINIAQIYSPTEVI